MISPPATPSTEAPSRKQCRFKDTGFPSEWAEDYRPGGLHPVHFGDQLKDGQYKIVRKLGDGSFSTVWLAHDNVYVALKILRSRESNITTELSIYKYLSAHSGGDPLADHITSLLGIFEIKGPNGSHQCLIFEPMGPSVASMVELLPSNQQLSYNEAQRYPKKLAKEILRQVISGLAFLHKHSIVHSDIQEGNMLFQIPGLDSFEEEQLQHDPSKISKPLVRRDGKKDLWGPRYLAISQSLYEYVDIEAEVIVKISDMGSAFWKQKPPQSTVTPIALRAPELIFEEPFGEGIDIWAIGCLIYELLTGSQLFPIVLIGNMKLEDADDDHILDLIDTLGPLPERLMEKWPRKDKWINESGDRLNPTADEEPYIPESDGDSESGSEASELGVERMSGNDESDEDLTHNPQGLAEPDQGSPFNPSDVSYTSDVFEGPIIAPPLEEEFEKKKPADMDSEEFDEVLKLIRDILQYDPAKRPTAAQLLEHSWFQKT